MPPDFLLQLTCGKNQSMIKEIDEHGRAVSIAMF